MRISDWSSDVCSSDLGYLHFLCTRVMSASSDLPRRWPDRSLPEPEMKLRYLFAVGLLSVLGACSKSHEATPAEPAATPVETEVPAVAAPAPEATRAESRSEENTSELK